MSQLPGSPTPQCRAQHGTSGILPMCTHTHTRAHTHQNARTPAKPRAPLLAALPGLVWAVGSTGGHAPPCRPLMSTLVPRAPCPP